MKRRIPIEYLSLREEMKSLSSFSAFNSISFKMQLSLLKCLFIICKFVFGKTRSFGTAKSGEQISLEIFSVVYIYLDEAMPSLLQKQSVKIIKQLLLLQHRSIQPRLLRIVAHTSF